MLTTAYLKYPGYTVGMYEDTVIKYYPVYNRVQTYRGLLCLLIDSSLLAFKAGLMQILTQTYRDF